MNRSGKVMNSRAPSENPAGRPTAAASELLAIVQELVNELHRGRAAVTAALDSSLDRDLGLDSLARMELLARLEKTFSVAVPERSVTEADSPRDLLRSLATALERKTRRETIRDVVHVDLGEAEPAPHSAETLVDVLDWHVRAHPKRPSIRLFSDEDEGEVLTYADLKNSAEALAAGLQHRGLGVGDSVSIMLPTSRGYFYSFLGILMAGGIPVPIYPPARPSHIEDHLTRHRRILASSGARFMITVPEAKSLARLLRTHVDTMQEVVTVDDLGAESSGYHAPVLGGDDLAFLQYTSGSTGDPKGVALSHANLLANVRAIGESIQLDDTDVAVSWLPLYHDMGLIGAWLTTMYFALPLVVMSPLDFISRPERWLWAIHRFRGTLSAAPNFAYELCLKKLRDENLEGLDLSSWRISCNGAEPVNADTVERFCERFAAFGFRRQAMFPVYGLAENSLAVTFPPIGRGPVYDRIERETFVKKGVAVPAGPDEANVLTFVSCGQPLPRHEVRIVDSGGRELPDRNEGRIEFKGPSATRGYYRNPEATERLFDGDWLDSGDKGYVAEGDLYITGRNKDIIIRAGQNIYPQELEAAVGEIDGVRKGNVAVFASQDEKAGTEKLVVFAETREKESKTLDAIRHRINMVASELIGTPPEDIVLAPPGSVPKTSSGKIRRAASRELYERGDVGAHHRAVWLQVVRLTLSGMAPEIRRSVRNALGLLYAGYAFAVFGLAAALAWFPVLLLPLFEWRWAVFRLTARLVMLLSGQRLGVQGREQVPRGRPCVFVANHSSYADSYVLPVALRVPFIFVGKAELRKRFIVRAFMSRVGVQFVERFDKQRSVEDARRIGALARKGRSVLFYPEGGTARMPGLRPFHMGAFVVAAESGYPVVPVVVRGTRSIFRTGSWFPRRGRVLVRIEKPIEVSTAGSADTWQAAVELRSRAREVILRHCGEPDLGHDKSSM